MSKTKKDKDKKPKETQKSGLKVKLGPDVHLDYEDELINYYMDEVGEKIKKKGHTPQTIADKMKNFCGPWPKRVGEALYYVQGDNKKERRILKNAASLFSWIMSEGMRVDWVDSGCSTATNKTTFFEFLKVVSRNYESIEILPHYPPRPDVHYEIFPEPEGNYSGYLDKVLDFLKPATEQDRTYLKALFLSVFWGGPGGARPTFLLLGPEEEDDAGGRGVGKTAITEVLSLLCGIYVDFSEKDKRKDITERLLTSDGSRLVTIDNVKEKLSSADLESLTTRRFISGKLMYVGNHSIPNFFTWIVTDNQPDFSKDMSLRTLPIRLARPERDPDWWEKVEEFVTKNKEKIIYDCIGILKGKPLVTLNDHIRFAQWSKAVLSRCTTNPDITAEIQMRQNQTDEENNILDRFIEIIDNNMNEYVFMGGMGPGMEYDRTTARYRVSQSLVVKWIMAEMPEMKPSRIVSLLAQGKPDWLVLPGNRVKTTKSGKRRIGVLLKGTQMVDIGVSRVSRTWVITQNHPLNRRIFRDMKVADFLTEVPPI